jgi:NAD(P)-dependent dehydrogenase (short-subunit alcohol dehydrogenase family)
MILKSKNILITGAGKGIGKACVNDFISKGGYVFALINQKKDNSKFKKHINLKIYNGNVNNQKIINKIFEESKKINKPINCLVNNAGLRFRKNFLKIRKDELRNVFETNFFSPFVIMQIFSKFLIKNKMKGSLINMTSIVGKIGFDELTGYASSKGALTSLTKSFAAEMSKYGINANNISPGFIKTSFYEKFKKDKKKLYNWTISRIPQKRWGEPREIAELASFILSNKSNYLNGETITIDGGWTNA